MRDLLETCFDEWSDVGTASSRALFSAEAMNSALATHLPALSDLSLDLQRRRDLAILLNSNGGTLPTSGELEFTAPADDSAAGVTRALAEAMADFVRDADMDTDTEAMAALEALLDRYSGQPEVLSAFYTELEPAGLLDLMASISGPYAEFGSDEYDQRASLLAEVKSTFAAAERTWGDAATAEYAKELVDRASGTMDRPSAYPFGFGGALSYLLYDSSYSDAFLTSAAEQIDLHERTTFGGNADSYWGWTSGGGPNPWMVYFPEDAQAGSYDLGVSFMSALANNPEVGLNFFMEGNQDGKVSDRQMYWLHNRDWEQDQFSHLSQALLAATTDPRLIQPWDSASAHDAAILASHTINLLGHREGLDSGMLNGEDCVFGDNADAAGNFARILSTYMYAADNCASRYGGEWDKGGASSAFQLFFGAGKVGQVPVFDRDSLQKFVVLASSTDEGMVALRSGLDAYAAAKYGLTVEALAAATADTHAVALENFQTAYRSQATLEGLFVNAVGKSAIKGAGDKDEIRTAWIGLGGDLVGLIPFGDLVTKAGGGKLAETVISFAIDQASDQIKDGVTESWASLKDKERAVRTEQADIAMQRARYQVLQVMQEHGLMPDYTNVPWASDGQLPTWSEYTNLTPSNQMSAVGDVMDVENGAGLSFDGIDFGEAYNSGFFEYYPK